MRDIHHAPRHRATSFADKPKDIVIREFEESHPGCTIENVSVFNGTVEIDYVKDAEVEAARLANEKPAICIGKYDGKGGYIGKRYW